MLNYPCVELAKYLNTKYLTKVVNRNSVESENILKFNLRNVECSLLDVERNWKKIDDELEHEKLGRRDTFDYIIRGRMMDAYRHLDIQLRKEVEPFSKEGIPEILELNNLVHYGHDLLLRLEYNQAILANSEKFARLSSRLRNGIEST